VSVTFADLVYNSDYILVEDGRATHPSSPQETIQQVCPCLMIGDRMLTLELQLIDNFENDDTDSMGDMVQPWSVVEADLINTMYHNSNTPSTVTLASSHDTNSMPANPPFDPQRAVMNLLTHKTITQKEFCRDYKRWGLLIDPIIHSAISLAYHDSNFTWPCDNELRYTNSDIVLLVTKVLVPLADAYNAAYPQDLLETGRSYFFSLYV
jgi:hypothetical protein